MSATLLDEMELQKIKERTQAAYDKHRSYIAKAEYWEDELRQALAPLSAKQKALQMLKSECNSLKEKRIAIDEELAERQCNNQNTTKILTESANRFRKELSITMEWEQSKRDVCTGLRREEHRLQSLASSLQASLQSLIATCQEEENCDNNLVQWRQTPSMIRLYQVEEVVCAEAEAARAVSALVDARRRWETFKHAYAFQLRALTGAATEHKENLRSLQEQCSDLTASYTNAFERARSWQKLCVQYTKRADGDMSVASKANRELEKNRCEVLAKDIALAADIEKQIEDLVEEWRCAIRWRLFASASPIFAAWLVSAWWLSFMRS